MIEAGVTNTFIVSTGVKYKNPTKLPLPKKMFIRMYADDEITMTLTR